jgi:hypothetical protein
MERQTLREFHLTNLRNFYLDVDFIALNELTELPDFSRPILVWLGSITVIIDGEV